MKIKAVDFDSIKQIVLKTSCDNLYIPLHGKHTTNPEEEPFDLEDKIKQFFITDEKNTIDPCVMLLMGDTGSGKSVFAQQLHQQLWKDYKAGNPIPLWIPLPELENPFEEAAEEVLRKHGFDDSQISKMKAREKFIFIVDGYDELHQFQNCYIANKWNQWSAKVLITCRSQALYYQKDYEKYFTPFHGEKRLPLLLRKLYVAPFSQDQISAYVKKYRANHSENNIAEEDFAKVRGLSDLITTPFLLHLAFEALPVLLENQADDQKMTQAKLYDVFIERWFTRQVAKLQTTGQLKDTEEKTKKYFWEYCKHLAQEMHIKELSVIPYSPPKIGGRLFGKQEQKSVWETFFIEESEVARSACPLKRMGEYHYGFIHESFVEYFATRAMYDEMQTDDIETQHESSESTVSEMVIVKNEVMNQRRLLLLSPVVKAYHEAQTGDNRNDDKKMTQKINQPSSGIHQRLFTREPQIIRFLADRIEQSEAFKKKMINIVESSKMSEKYSVGSANAITALIRAGVTFNGEDLSKIKISGADISGGYFDGADLSLSDLSNTLMMNVWLREANLDSCNVEGINFGEFPCLQQDENVDCFDYREDLQRLVSGCKENIILWDTLTGEQLGIFKGHTEFIYGVKFNSSGKWIVSGSADKTVRLWDAESVAEIALLEGHDDYVSSVDFSPDDKFIVSGSDDSTIRLWDVEKAMQKAILIGHEESVNSVHFTLNGEQIISASNDNTVRIWDVVSTKEVCVLEHDIEAHTAQISQNGRLVVSGCGDDLIQVWDVTDKKLITELCGHEDCVNCLAISADGGKVVSGSHDSSVRIWDIASRKILTVLRGHETEVHCVQFNTDGKQVVSGSWDKTIRFWDISNERFLVRKRGHEGQVSCIDVSFDRKLAVTGAADYSVRIWEIASGQEVATLRGHDGNVLSVRFSPDRKMVVSGGWDHTIRIWNVELKTEYKVLMGHTTPVNSVAFSLTGKNIISCSGEHDGDDNTIRIWDAESGNQLAILHKHRHEVRSVSFSKDEKQIVFASSDNSIHITEAVYEGKELILLPTNINGMSGALFSPNEQFVACFGSSQVKIIEIKSGKEIFDVHSDEGGIINVQFCHDEKSIIIGCNMNLETWDIASEQCIDVWKFHARMTDFSFYLNESLILGFFDHSVECWQNFEDEHNYRWQLKWSTNIDSPNLFIKGLNISNVMGLNDQNRRMLEQRGALVDSKTELTERRGKASLRSGILTRINSPIHQKKMNMSDLEEHEEDVDLHVQSIDY